MPDSLAPEISILIPAYNEEKRIGLTLEKYIDFFEKSKYKGKYELVVILNGCKDNTEKVVSSFIPKTKALRYEVYPEAIGKGGAIIKGYENSLASKAISYVDADNSTRPEMLYRLLEVFFLINNLDAVIGSRNLPSSIVTGKSKNRKILTKGFNLGVNILFNLNILDTQCGAKVIGKQIMDKVLPNLFITNMAFDVNLLVAVNNQSGVIFECPIEWEDNLDTKIKNPLKTSLGMALSVLRMRIVYSPLRFIIEIIEPFAKFLYNFFRNNN